ALAEALRDRGADVILVHGHISVSVPEGIQAISALCNEDMNREIQRFYGESDMVVMAAAVSDFKVREIGEDKIKKDGDTLILELVKDKDILEELGEKKKNQILIGFAAESRDLEANAREKLERKNLDYIAAN